MAEIDIFYNREKEKWKFKWKKNHIKWYKKKNVYRLCVHNTKEMVAGWDIIKGGEVALFKKILIGLGGLILFRVHPHRTYNTVSRVPKCFCFYFVLFYLLYFFFCFSIPFFCALYLQNLVTYRNFIPSLYSCIIYPT